MRVYKVKVLNVVHCRENYNNLDQSALCSEHNVNSKIKNEKC